jgi:uridine phosphorylase
MENTRPFQAIPESELIINNRGAIYHLNVRPEELANNIILVGDPERVEKVSKHFDQIDHKFHHREFITHTGRIGKHAVSVVSTGIGPDNIDIAVNELDALANIDFTTRTIKPELQKLNIVRLGTSGALQADIPVDSLVASTHGLGFDNLMNYYVHQKSAEEKAMMDAFLKHTKMNTDITRPYIFKGSDSLLSMFDDDFFKGITVTAPGFYGPQGRELRLKSETRKLIDDLSSYQYNQYRITNFEMETSAIFGLGKLLGHECMSINVIIANRVIQQYSKDANAAVEKMIAKSLDVLFGSN